MKKISFALFFCLCALAGFAQNSKPLDLKEIVSGEFIPQNISGVIPIPGDGEHYSQMNADKTQIIKYSFKTGKPVEVLFDAATARECPFKKFDSYSFAPDGSKLLIATETVPVYRHSYTAVHYIYSLLNGKAGRNKSPSSRPMETKWLLCATTTSSSLNYFTATAKAR